VISGNLIVRTVMSVRKRIWTLLSGGVVLLTAANLYAQELTPFQSHQIERPVLSVARLLRRRPA
jgi:hypothetical protein